MNGLIMIGIGWLAMILVMSILWKWQQRSGKAGIVDVAWPLGVAALSVFFCFGTTGGLLARRALVATLALLWGIRLGWHIWTRLKGESDDPRYLQLKDQWGEQFQRRLWWFYQVQALAAVLFALPMWLAAQNGHPLNVLDAVGVAIWLIALGGELLADRQLKQFKADSSHQGKVCRRGLWRYTRHPNYFFEWIHWWSYVAFAWLAPFGWLALLAPAAMYYLIVYVTGIPPAERSSLKNRGEAYREYQKTTNAFFPGPPQPARDSALATTAKSSRET